LLTLLISVVLAMVLGFASSRASFCTVRAVAEIISTRRAAMLWGTVKSMMWVLALTLPIIWLVPALGANRTGWPLSALSLAGGMLYGAGAAINGACAFSTLSQLADGRVRMLLTLTGFLGGGAAGLLATRGGSIRLPTPIPLPTERLFPWALLLAGGLAVWGTFEIYRLWRTRPADARLTDLIVAQRYRLSTAAALIGLSNGVLYLLEGSWSYTSTLERAVRTLFAQPDPALPMRLVLFAAAFAGMLLSTWQRKSLRLDWRPRPAWLRNLLGGAMMGLGALFAPGGNDSLVFYGMPSLSPHAAPAYAAMLAGIFVTLIAMRRLLSMEMKIDCTGDVCVALDG
jgi:hypothetical protein